MSDYIEVIAIVEGKTEQIFIKSILAPYLGNKKIYINATQVSKPGQKGGDIKFSRVKKDIRNHLKQRKDTYITTLVDYYGITEWPGLEKISENNTYKEIAQILNESAKNAIINDFSEISCERFIPNIVMHEFEAYHFSDSMILSLELGQSENEILDILNSFEHPEEINNSKETAPSKRLDSLSSRGKFPKTTMGIEIIKKIRIEKVREKCPLFNNWLTSLENLVNS